jgi:hypothetical protein
MTENGYESTIANKALSTRMPFSCNINRDLTAIVEIGRLLKPVSQVRILPGHFSSYDLG